MKDENGENLPNDCIKLFLMEDKRAANLRDSEFAVHLELPRFEINEDEMYHSMGFSEEDIRSKKIFLSFVDDEYESISEYSNGKDKKRITGEQEAKFRYEVMTPCFAIKIKILWNSNVKNVYPDYDLVKRYVPDVGKYYYVSVDNEALSKAEIPFLIFDKNKGKCFMKAE